MTVVWNDELDAIFAADLTAALSYRTPAGGVVVQAVAPIGMRDRDAGTLSFTTSLGFSKKLERIAVDPRVAMAFHAREHGSSSSTRYVLTQGTARVIERPSERERSVVRTNGTAYLGEPKQGPFWDFWMREYYVSRVPVEVTVTRIITWPTLDAAGSPTPCSASRSGPTRPVVVPVRLVTEDESGLVLSSAPPLPAGGRRAGLLGHSYEPRLIGLNTRQHTGWLEVDDDRAVYAPHTEAGFRTPSNKTLQLFLNGAFAKKGVRQAARTPTT